MDEAKSVGRRLRELRCWRRLTLRDAAGLAGVSFSFWGQVERGEKPVATRKMLEAMAGALRVAPAELTGQPWSPQDPTGADTQAGLDAIETALERYQLGTDPEFTVRPWPRIAEDLDRLVTTMTWSGDYTAQAALVPGLLGELHGAYVRRGHQRGEVLLGLVRVYSRAVAIANLLGIRGLPSLAALRLQQCAETLDDPLWLGYAAWWRGYATGRLDRAAHYRRSLAAAQSLTSRLDSGDALQACGLLHLSAAWAAGAQADYDTATAHLDEAWALATRMGTEVGSWAHLWFGATTVGVWKTSIALEIGEYGQARQAAKVVHPELLPAAVHQAGFWADVGRILAAETKTREQAVHVLVRAERLAPQRIRHDLLVREAVGALLRRARRDAGGRELRGLAWRMGIAPVG